VGDVISGVALGLFGQGYQTLSPNRKCFAQVLSGN